VGTKAILLTDMDENRSEDVVVVDLRVDKSWTFGGRYRVTAIADVYNLLDLNLPGRTLKLGLRVAF
jgi:hypothetical protein